MLRNLFIIGAIAVVATTGSVVGLSSDAVAGKKKPGYSDASESSARYSDKVLGLKELKDLPVRPTPLFELWQAYVEGGEYDYEFELPTGMVVSPGLVLFGNINTGLEITDDGVNDTDARIVTNLSLFLNLTLSGTERILLGVSPLRQENGATSHYQFEPTSGWRNEGNARLSTAFFEGELSEMFPKIDMGGRLPLDYEIAFGRQPVVSQGGILIADTMDSVALTRSTVPLPGTNFARIGGLFAWNNVQRSNQIDDDEGELYAIFTAVEAHHSTFELDLAYIDSTRAIGDQLNIGASLIRPFIILEHAVDATIRLAHSHTPDDSTAQASDGTLLYASFGFAPKQTDNIVYINGFAASNSYAPAARSAGGPLGITGLLFAPNGLAGPGIPNRADDTVGGAIGYQMFFSPKLRRNLIFEIGGKVEDAPNGVDRFGVAARYSQAFGQHLFFELGGFAVSQESLDEAFGLRTKVNVAF